MRVIAFWTSLRPASNKMKKTIIALLAGAAMFGSCTKDADNTCPTVETTAPATEVAALQAYISSNGITSQADSRGFFYTIAGQGSDLRPTACSDVRVNYTLRLTNGMEVEANNGVSFNLSGLIPGWQEGLPLIGEGGSITLYLPPSLAYGSRASGNIPANSNLVFQIDLVDVK